MHPQKIYIFSTELLSPLLAHSDENVAKPYSSDSTIYYYIIECRINSNEYCFSQTNGQDHDNYMPFMSM